MRTFLLAWNPKRWEWSDLPEMAKAVKKGDKILDRWGTGNSRKPQKGDRFFLMRLGKEPRGIFASGHFQSGTYEDLHWDVEKSALGETANYAEIIYDVLRLPETDGTLPIALLQVPPFSQMQWNIRMSGVEIPQEIAKELEKLWGDFLNSTSTEKGIS